MTDATPADQDLPTRDDRRWALLAAELPFEQLDNSRRQAEGWRNGLTALTTVLGAVLLVRGRDNLSAVGTPWRLVVAAMIVVAFGALVSAIVFALSAAHGAPGVAIWSDGVSYRRYVDAETARIGRLLLRALALTIVGVTLVLLSAVVSGLAPADDGPPSVLVSVSTAQDTLCGRLSGIDARRLVVTAGGGVVRTRVLALADVTRLEVVSACR